ncbi:MAG: hypothetical protein QUS33_03885 [Dehalococcoidia bacterium]|nr:hypothetical protein [Dehalococcoidia bacterium]
MAFFVVESVARGGESHYIQIGGCDTDELERAAEELERATAELVKRAAELANRSEELNRQLLRLAEALARPTMIKPPEVKPGPSKLADAPKTGQPQDSGILAEVRELLDGPEGRGGASWQDPRD